MEPKIDDLIEAGWSVLDCDFHPISFLRWRRMAFDFLTHMLGPDHEYTRHFEELVRQGRKTDRLAAVGILGVADKLMAQRRQDRLDEWSPESAPALTFKTGGSIDR